MFGHAIPVALALKRVIVAPNEFVPQGIPPTALVPTLRSNSSDDNRNSFIWNIQNLNLFALDRKSTNQYSFYVRKVSADLFNYLRHAYDPNGSDAIAGQVVKTPLPGDSEAPKVNIFYICGTSGTGKTTVVSAFVGSVSTAEYRFWVTNDLGGLTVFCIEASMNDAGVLVHAYHRFRGLDESEVKTLLQLLPSGAVPAGLTKGIIVFDGKYAANPLEIFSGEMFQRGGALLVRCESGAPSSMYAKSVAKYFTGNVFCVSGFTLDEYKQAKLALRHHGVRLNSVADSSKYHYYCGGNFRLFLWYNDLKDLKYQMDVSMRKIHNTDAFFSGSIGSLSSDAVPSLLDFMSPDDLYFSPPVAVIISSYVAETLLYQTELKYIKQAKHILPKNGSYQGWLFAEEIKVRVKMLYESKLDEVIFINRAGKPVHTLDRVDKTLNFFHYEDLADLEHYGYSHKTEVRFYAPMSCRNADFDAVIVVVKKKHAKVYFLQATVSANHSCTLTNAGAFLSQVFAVNSADPSSADRWTAAPVVAAAPAAAAPVAPGPVAYTHLTLQVQYCIVKPYSLLAFTRVAVGNVDVTPITAHQANFTIQDHPVWYLDEV